MAAGVFEADTGAHHRQGWRQCVQVSRVPGLVALVVVREKGHHLVLAGLLLLTRIAVRMAAARPTPAKAAASLQAYELRIGRQRESVADPGHGEYEDWFSGVVAKLVAQVLDVGVDRALGGLRIVAANRGQ